MQCMPSTQGFLGLPKDDAVSYDQAKAVIIPFGLEKTASFGKGTAHGPQAMLTASHQLELFDEQLWCEPYRNIGIVTASTPEMCKDISDDLLQLKTMVASALSQDKFPFVFGGEHSITARAITPFVKRYPNLAILHFDAHADLRDSYDGEKYSHACAMRRCLDYPNIELVSCGIRSISAEEIPFLEKNKHRIRTYWAKDKAQWDLNEIFSHLKGRPVYLTFDLYAFDSSLMAHLSQVDCFGKRQLI